MQTRRRRPSLLNGASIAVCLLALARSAGAVDGTWTSPATGLWSDSLNWLGGTVANGFDATANFDTIDTLGDVAVHLDTARTIGNLIFGDVDGATTPGDWLLDNNGNAANILTLQATGTPTITVNALGDGKSVTIQAEIAGLNGINKAGVGTLTLTGANSYTGGTTLSGGILAFSALNNLGSGGITFDGGTLQWAGTNTTDISTRTVTIGPGGGTLDVVANNVTLANAIGNNGAGSLTKTGAGTLTLNGVNTYSGGTLLNAGIILISADAALGAATGGVTFSGTSTLRFGGAFTLPATRTITSNAGVTGTLDIQANAITVAGPLVGAGAFTKSGSAVLTYTGTTASGFTGALNINTGIFRVAAGSTLAAGSFTVAATAGAQFHVNGGAFTSSALSTVNQTGAGFLIDSGTAAFNGGIRTNGDNGGVIRVSGGTFTASDVNVQRNSAGTVDFTRGFILSGGTSTVGTIRLGSANSNGAMSVEGGNLTANGAVTIGNQQTSGRGGAMRVTSGTFTSTDTVDGIVLGKTNLVNGNANNVASATFTGGVSKVEKFTLGFDSTVTAGSSTIAVNGGTLYLGSGGIVKNGTSGLTTAVNLTAGLIGANADWASAVSVSTGTTATNNITIKAASDADVAHDITINGVTGSGGFTKTGGGKLIIGGNSTYNGGSVGTTISAGTLQVGSGGTAGTLGTSVVINNGILAFNRTDALTFANNISGTGALEHNGTGTTTLSGTNTYAGNTTINAGTLRVASSLPSPVVTVNSTGTLGGTGALAGAVTVNNGGRLAPSDAAGTAPATLTLGSVTLSSGSILDVDFTSLSTFDKVVVTGTNGLTINGVGINLYTSNTVTPWTTTGSYNLFQYTGDLGGLAATNLSSALTILNPLGSLTYNFSSAGGFITLDIGTVGVTPTWIATGGGSWNTAGNWNTTAPNAQDATAKFGSAISAPSTVTLDGNKTVGVIEFGNANAYTIAQGTSGTLTLSKSSGSAAVDNVSGSHTISAPVSLASPTIVTVFDPADTLTVSGAVSGANSLTKSGLGTLALPSANSFGGGATLAAGTLRIGHNQSLGTAAATVTGNGTLQFGANNLAPANDVVVNSGATATIDTQSNSATLAGVVSGDGALNKAGSGRLVLLSSANSYNGPTTITAGVLSVDNLSDGSFPSPIGQSANDAANLVLNGGTLEYTGTGISTDRLFRLRYRRRSPRGFRHGSGAIHQFRSNHLRGVQHGADADAFRHEHRCKHAECGDRQQWHRCNFAD